MLSFSQRPFPDMLRSGEPVILVKSDRSSIEICSDCDGAVEVNNFHGLRPSMDPVKLDDIEDTNTQTPASVGGVEHETRTGVLGTNSVACVHRAVAWPLNVSWIVELDAAVLFRLPLCACRLNVVADRTVGSGVTNGGRMSRRVTSRSSGPCTTKIRSGEDALRELWGSRSPIVA